MSQLGIAPGDLVADVGAGGGYCELAVTSNTYRRVDGRVDSFRSLLADLAPTGRVAILELDDSPDLPEAVAPARAGGRAPRCTAGERSLRNRCQKPPIRRASSDPSSGSPGRWAGDDAAKGIR